MKDADRPGWRLRRHRRRQPSSPAAVAQALAESADELAAAERVAAIASRLTASSDAPPGERARIARRAFDYVTRHGLEPEEACLVSLVKWCDEARTASEQSIATEALRAFLYEYGSALPLGSLTVAAARSAAIELAQASLPAAEHFPRPPEAVTASGRGEASSAQPGAREAPRQGRLPAIARALLTLVALCLIVIAPFLLKFYFAPLQGYEAAAFPRSAWIVNPAKPHEIAVRAAAADELAAVGFDPAQGCSPYQLFLFKPQTPPVLARIIGRVQAPVTYTIDGATGRTFDEYRLLRGAGNRAFIMALIDVKAIRQYQRGSGLSLSIGGEADAATFTLSGFSRALRQAQANCTNTPTLP